MINDIKQTIVNKVMEVFPAGYTVYDEELPEGFSKPSFYLTLMNQTYSRHINNKFTSLLSFDLAYYSNSAEVRTDSLGVQENLLRAFDSITTYRILNRNAKMIDNVLHFSFDIRYTEAIQDEVYFMQQKQLKTNL